ncbi:bacillithiol system redox-active protein YtxJ [bacterium]|nr:MAG: bacillithiol system redox-active protein YtxJ [bacterium]
MLHQITTADDLQNALEASNTHICLIYKHSTMCPVSYRAYLELQAVMNESLPDSLKIFMIDVISNRAVSMAIADKLQVRHESPQVLFINKGEAILNYSHSAIRKEKILIDIKQQVGY